VREDGPAALRAIERARSEFPLRWREAFARWDVASRLSGTPTMGTAAVWWRV